MKKFIAFIMISAIIFSMTSCGNTKNKKIITEDLPKIADETPDLSQADSKNDAPKPNDSLNVSNDQKENTQNTAPDALESTSIDKLPEGLSNVAYGNWMPGRTKDHSVPALNKKYKNLLEKYDGYFVGDTSSKVVYLTFDEGYEYKFTGKILDILKANDVKANFFVLKSYIKLNPDLVKRMVAEGHLVGNHTTTHPNMPKLLSEKGVDAVVKELTNTADYFKEITGKDMPKFYRPPEGVISEATLYIAKSLGYKTILWSIAHRDWDTNNQPGKDASYKLIEDNYHNGAIILLHPQSQSNTEALDDIIKNLKSKGYRFALLTELK